MFSKIVFAFAENIETKFFYHEVNETMYFVFSPANPNRQ